MLDEDVTGSRLKACADRSSDLASSKRVRDPWRRRAFRSMAEDLDGGSFQLLVQVFACSVDGLEPGSWSSKRPRLEAELGAPLGG